LTVHCWSWALCHNHICRSHCGSLRCLSRMWKLSPRCSCVALALLNTKLSRQNSAFYSRW